MTLELYRAKQGPKQLYLVPGADHAQSLRENPHIYDRIVGEFLEELCLATNETKMLNLEETESEEFANNRPSDTSGFEDDVHYDDLLLV
jgi:hypothetical protein